MKQQLITIVLLSATLISCDDDVMPEKVPLEVRKNLLATFPLAFDIAWEKSGKDYEADFTVHAAAHSALFQHAGALTQYKRAIPAAQLPEAVANSIAKKYPGYQISEAEAFVKNHNTSFQIVLKNQTAEMEVVFSADGQQLQQPFWD
ncbi:PepSY-like domain-containing protein [Pontibacter sp. BT731]|uniref:PepSY-like domain-containing protein n=1 Tax=Pontibacter coccineus TaxID=3063328 RepID=UPI0026E21449|nr:PepSY-like domain-containing protein [Pontibacter sp. BT731]MDO6390965.1 PepSY-like domain-containing protein [Pontibacter sp. BT731]